MCESCHEIPCNRGCENSQIQIPIQTPREKDGPLDRYSTKQLKAELLRRGYVVFTK